MSACCVTGCKYTLSSTNNLNLYRIPVGNKPSQANRRRLWLAAIQHANGSTEQLNRNSRVCSAHFVSGKWSLDRDSPDFVPSVFPKNSPIVKKKTKRYYGQTKRQRHTDDEETDVTTTPPRVYSPVQEEIQLTAEPKEGETEEAEHEIEEAKSETEEAVTETKTIVPQTYSPYKTSPSFQLQVGIIKLDKRVPILALKSVCSAAGLYRCELCNQNFTDVSRLVKHKQLHEEGCQQLQEEKYGQPLEEEYEQPHERQGSFSCETCGNLFWSLTGFSEHQCVLAPSFPCNMCERSFSTNFNLKRHKLLHVKDGRKCQKCGVLFCQRHGHVLFRPQTPSQQDAFAARPLSSSSDSKKVLKKEPGLDGLDDDDQSSLDMYLPTTTNRGHSVNAFKAPRQASHTKSHVVPQSPPLIPRYPWSLDPSTQIMPDLHDPTAAFVQPRNLELPPSLKMFSPQLLTSVFLEVKRNYQYILSNPKT